MTTRNRTEPMWCGRPDARLVEESSTERAGFIAGLQRARSWRVPPNWSAADWHQELRAVALAAAWQAEQDHDPSRGVPLDGFVYSRVIAQALTRYRQEWRYALHIAHVEAGMVEAFAGAHPAVHPAGAAFESLNRAISQLPEQEGRLLKQLFWQHRTEASIAAELHISQPAVNKRKRVALFHLRALL